MRHKHSDDVDIPPIWCPFEARVNEQTTALVDSVAKWLRAGGICDSDEFAYAAAATGAYGTAYTMPAATGTFAEAMSRYMAWGFVLDDHVEDAGTSIEQMERFIALSVRLMRVMEVPGCVLPDDDPHTRACADIAAVFHALAPRSRLRRIFDGWRAYLFGLVQEGALQRTASVPTLDAYLPLRFTSGAGGVVCAMIEMSLGTAIDQNEIESPLGRALTETAFTVTLLDNETLSRRRERAQEKYDLNLVRVLHANGHCSPRQAPRLAAEIRDRILGRFLELRERVHAEHSPAMGAYADGLAEFIAGVVAFMPTDQRYAAAEPPSAGESTSTRAPGHLADGPLATSSVAWWWGPLDS
ncbi:terpene synthase family protein [Nocardia sp. NPDC051321]|uniref:terpene synthase family protein n=1 Tax=Nocardia sp. NPDC051321 TaxID=3364323 RepID=UPI0037A4DA09